MVEVCSMVCCRLHEEVACRARRGLATPSKMCSRCESPRKKGRGTTPLRLTPTPHYENANALQVEADTPSHTSNAAFEPGMDPVNEAPPDAETASGSALMNKTI